MIIRPYFFAGRMKLSGAGLKIVAFVFVAFVLVVLIGFSVVPATPVAAQDIIGPETKRVTTETGPYTVVAEAKALPSLQAATIIANVTDTDTGNPVEDVRVTVLTSLSGSDETGWAHAISPNAPGVYSATVELKTPGIWDTSLLIEAPDDAQYPAQGFVFEVIPPSTNTEAGYVFIGVALVLAAGAAYLVWRIRRNQRQRAQRSGVPTP